MRRRILLVALAVAAVAVPVSAPAAKAGPGMACEGPNDPVCIVISAPCATAIGRKYYPLCNLG